MHNTETPSSQTLQETVDSISKTHEKRFGYDTKSCKWVEVAYHYLISKDWTVVQTRCLDEIGYHNSKNNSKSIWIALVWNFNNEKPSKEQYQALNVLLWVLTQVFTGAEIKPHWGRWSSCPWKNFDSTLIGIGTKKSLLGKYNMTRYYSPTTGQSEYMYWKTYEQDVTTQCWKDAIGNDWCSIPANNIRLTEKDVLKVVACPWEFPLGTRFEIKWYWWVTCVDRWWSIKWRTLDIRAWYGELWMWRIKNTVRPAGDITITNIDFSNIKR